MVFHITPARIFNTAGNKNQISLIALLKKDGLVL